MEQGCGGHREELPLGRNAALLRRRLEMGPGGWAELSQVQVG